MQCARLYTIMIFINVSIRFDLQGIMPASEMPRKIAHSIIGNILLLVIKH